MFQAGLLVARADAFSLRRGVAELSLSAPLDYPHGDQKIALSAGRYQLAADGRGFFLLIEGSKIDKRSHPNDGAAVLRELAARRPILLCDELICGLDADRQARVMSMLRERRAETAVLFITTDLHSLTVACSEPQDQGAQPSEQGCF